MYCIYCGKKNPEDAKYCGSCGKPTVVPVYHKKGAEKVTTTAFFKLNSNPKPQSSSTEGYYLHQTKTHEEPSSTSKETTKKSSMLIPVLAIIAGIALIVLFFVIFPSSNEKTKSLDDILSDIVSEDSLYRQKDVKIAGSEITNRETNQKSGIDYAWVRVNSAGEKFESAKADYKLIYNFYDDEWHLSDCERYSLEVSPPEQYSVDDYVSEYGITNFQLLGVDQIDGTTYKFNYLSYDESYDYLKIEKTHSIEMKFSSYPDWDWHVNSFDTSNSYYILETDGFEGDWTTSITRGNWAYGYRTYDVYISINQISSTGISFDYVIDKDGERLNSGSVNEEWNIKRYNSGSREFYLFVVDEIFFSTGIGPSAMDDYRLAFKSNIIGGTSEEGSGLLIEFGSYDTYSGGFVLEKAS